MNAKNPSAVRSGWTIAQWQHAYREEGLLPEVAFAEIETQWASVDTAWIARADRAELARQLETLHERLAQCNGDLSALPLYGVPFAVKDNIDAAGWPTTAACPEFAYVAQADSGVVARLRAAGAILVGKTNLDQFACGLVGTRSPYGEVANTFDERYVSGGSSSGSASVVARGLVAFSLGTDTAGSGRVPAGFNNIVGLKPTKGWLSTAGVVPACRTLDCVSIFALTVDDASTVADIAGGYDAADPYSRHAVLPTPNANHHSSVNSNSDVNANASTRLRLGVPDTLEFFGDPLAQKAFERAVQAFTALGAEIIPIRYAPFAELASLLYAGPWVAERLHAIETLLRDQPDVVDPTVRAIVENGKKYSAVDTFDAEYRRAALSRTINDALDDVDALLVPTSPTIYTRSAMRENPIVLNSHFGTYTNFTNLADLCALALPEGVRDDGLPTGITLISHAWRDQHLVRIGRRWQQFLKLDLGATGLPFPASPQARPTDPIAPPFPPPAPSTIRVAVVGAHLTGMPLNHQLTSRDAVFVAATQTAATYRLYALANTQPPKPGLVRCSAYDPQGAAIEVELWDVPAHAFGGFVEEVTAPLGIGTVALIDGSVVKGFICEPVGLAQARDITAHGGWRAFLNANNAAPADTLAQ